MKLALIISLIGFSAPRLALGQIYIANGNWGVAAYTLAGEPSNVTFAAPPAGSGLPKAVALDSHGNIFVLLGGGVVAKYNPAGSLLQTFNLGFYNPYGIALDQDDNVYVSDFSGNRILKYSASGVPVNLSFITGLSGPVGMTFDKYGHLFVANWRDGTIGEYNLDGTPVNTALISGLNGPWAIASDGHLHLFVSNNGAGTIDEYAVNGVAIRRSLISGLNYPYGIAVAGTNTLLVENWGFNKLGKYGIDGSTLNASFITGLDNPLGIAVNLLEPLVTPQLSLPTSVVSGSGTLTNAGRLSLSGLAPSNVVFSLQSTDPSRLSAPATVTVPAGSSEATFDIVAANIQPAGGDRQVTITASAPSFVDAAAVVTVFDNTTNHFVQLSATAFGVLLTNYPALDLIYDKARDRLVVSIGASSASAPADGLTVINPYTGVTESFSPMFDTPGSLAPTSDGQYVYLSLPQIGVLRRLLLSDFSTDLEFFAGSSLTADKLAVVPGQPDQLVATLKGLFTGAASGIGLYNRGVLGPNVSPSGAWSIAFDTDTNTLFACNAGDLRRCSVDPPGIAFVEQFPKFSSAGTDIKYAAGRLFTSDGRVVRTQPFGVTWLFSGAENASLVAPDAASGRVFYLANTGGWQIKAFDMVTHRPLGTIPIPNLAGKPLNLIRWGAAGLALCTSSNQLYAIRSPLVQTNAGADLSLVLNGPATPVAVSNNAIFSLTVSNSGPDQAVGIQITNAFSPLPTLVSVSPGVGTCTTNGGLVVWSVPALDAGAQAALSVAIKVSQTGLLTATASATSTSADPFLGNNTVQQTLIVGAPPALDGVGIVRLPANDLCWSPALGKLFVTASTNTPNWGGALLTLDPYVFSVQFQAALGSDAQKMALSSDGSVLDVGVDSAVAMLSLPDFARRTTFVVNSAAQPSFAYALKSDPASSDTVVVGAKRRDANTIWVGAYDDGLQRSNVDTFPASGVSLEFADASDTFYAKDSAGAGFRTYSFSPLGVALLSSDTTVLPTQTAMDLLWGGSRMFTSVGKVIDPVNRTILGSIAGIPSGSKVQYDAASGRVFYLCFSGGQTVLKAFDGGTLLPVGSQVIEGVKGPLGSFVRWGMDGFAAVATNGQLALFRSRLVATNPPADVAVSLTLGSPPYFAGSNLTATLLITNQGPNVATDLLWTNTLPTSAAVLSATTTAGDIATRTNLVFGSITNLAAGGAAVVSVTYVVPVPAIAASTASAVASSIDPVYSNNVAMMPMWVQPAGGLSPITALSLPVKDLERDPIRPLLYASFDSTAGAFANTVVSLDPVNGAIGPTISVGSNPGRLAASWDGQFLYVALDGMGTVEKLTLPGLTPVSSFPVAQGQIVSQMRVCPTNSEILAIRRTPANATALFVRGVKLPNELSTQNLFAFSASGQLYACDGAHSNVKLYRLNTGAGGLSLAEGQAGKQTPANDLKGSGDLLFFDRGMIVNADAERVTGIMPVPVNSVVEPDTENGRVFYLTPAGSSWTLRAFDIGQGIEIGTLAIPGLLSPPVRLLRWGQSGLALCTTNSQLVILNGPLLARNPAVDVVLTQVVPPGPASTNDTLTIALQLTNFGPVTASGVIVTQSFSLGVTNVVLTPSVGTASFTNGAAQWQVGDLPTNTAPTLNVTVKAIRAGSLSIASSAYHDLNDVFWGNNAALNAIAITNPTTSDDVLVLQLAARKLVYDALRGRIYASTPASNRLTGNLVAVIDPANGRLSSALPAGSEPDQLTLSGDCRFLYVGANGAAGVRRFNLELNLPDLAFPLSTDDIYSALDLSVQPNHPDTVAASLQSYNLAGGYPSSVYLYDNGVAQPVSGGPARGLTFDALGRVLFGYVSPGVGSSLVRMWVTSDGFSTDTQPVFSSVPGNLQYANGRVYSAAGQVADPFAPALLGTFTGGSGPQAIDSAAGRAYFLAQRSTSNWEIRAFDLGTFQPAGTQSVTSVQGTPASLVRCGANRLAFCTTSNQVFIVRSSLVVTNPLPSANLSVTQTAIQDFATPTESLHFEISVNNQGPAAASNVLVAIAPPEGAAGTSIALPEGTATNIGAGYLCTIDSLAAGRGIVLTLDAAITNTLVYSNLVSVSSASPDPDPSDNLSLSVLRGLYFQRADSTSILTVGSRALAYDPLGQVLFAATSGANSQLMWFDVETGTLQGSMPLDFPPDSLISTENGEFLYVSGTQNGVVKRLYLPSRTWDLLIAPSNAVAVSTMTLVPGHPHSIAMTWWTTNTPITEIFDDGVPRPQRVEGGQFTLLTMATDGSALYGYANTGTGGASPDVFRMSVTAAGVQSLDFGPSDTPWGNNHGMRFAVGRLFFENGNVLNPATWTEEQAFSLPNWGSGMDIVPAVDRIGFLTSDFYDYALNHVGFYAISNRQLVAQLDIRTGSPGASLTWCGLNRFAFRTANQIVLVRSTALPVVPDSSRPTISLLNTPLPPSSYPVLQIQGQPGSWYALQSSSDLVNWSQITNFFGTSYQSRVTDVSATPLTRFFRVIQK